MPIYKPKELHAFLDSLEAFPKKRLSQNFLIDGNIVRKIIDTAKITEDDFIFEIGPGPGALTEAVLSTGAHILAVEKDPIFAEHLQRFDKEEAQLKVICDDVLNVQLPKMKKKIKILGNLPYNITTPILTKFLESYHSKIESLTFMVQDEVAQRTVAQPKTPEYSALTVFLHFYADVEYAFKVTKNCFYPIPSVDSAIISIRPKTIAEGVDPEAFFTMTRKAFQMRRKTLKKSLKGLYSEDAIQQALDANELSSFTRPEELSIDQFIAFYKVLCQTL